MIAFTFTDSQLWPIAGWTMLHVLWIGLLIGGAALAVRPLIRSMTAQSRYLIALGWFALLAISPLPVGWWVWKSHSVAAVTIVAMERSREGEAPAEPHVGTADEKTGRAGVEIATVSSPRPPVAASPRRIPPGGGDVVVQGSTVETSQHEHRPPHRIAADAELEASPSNDQWHVGAALVLRPIVNALPWLWLVGTPLTFVLLAMGMLGAERLRRQTCLLDDSDIVATLARLSTALGLRIQVAIGICDRIAGPILVGIIRPMILLPATALGHWAPEQLEMVLLHELSHVRRWDNLVNFLQRVVESLLFFVPTVWLVSRWVRAEREHCCDCSVVAHTGKAREYAQTLVQLADRRLAPQASARNTLSGLLTSPMAEHQLLARVRQILKSEDESMKISRTLLSSVVLSMTALLATIGWYGASSSTAQDEVQNPTAEPVATDPLDKELLRNVKTQSFQGKEYEPAESKGGQEKQDERRALEEKKAANDDDGQVQPVTASDVVLETPPAREKSEPKKRMADDAGRKGRTKRKASAIKGGAETGRDEFSKGRVQVSRAENVFSLRFLDDVTVSSDRVRTLESLKVQPGDVVKAGDELARFTQEDVEKAQAEVDIAQVKVRAAKKIVEEIDKLV